MTESTAPEMRTIFNQSHPINDEMSIIVRAGIESLPEAPPNRWRVWYYTQMPGSEPVYQYLLTSPVGLIEDRAKLVAHKMAEALDTNVRMQMGQMQADMVEAAREVVKAQARSPIVGEAVKTQARAPLILPN